MPADFRWVVGTVRSGQHGSLAAGFQHGRHSEIAHPSSLIDERIGFRIGERLGWPAEASVEVCVKSDAGMPAQQDFFARPQPLSRAGVDRLRDDWLQVARVGEVAATRALATPPAPAATPYFATPPPAR